MFRIQEQLATLHRRLEEYDKNREQAETKYRQVEDQLDARNRHYSNISSQHSKAQADGEPDFPFGGLALVLMQDYIPLSRVATCTLRDYDRDFNLNPL